MGMIWFLKALGDLSVYYLFAGPVAAYFGGSKLLLCVLMQSAAYAVARCARKKWLLVPAISILVSCFWLCLGSAADLVALLPSTGYLIWQFLQKRPVPVLLHQREFFAGIWKLLLGAAVLALVVSGILTLLPFALLALAANVLLLRTLRHSPEVYQRPGFQLLNLGAVAVVPVGALLLGAGPVWTAVSGGIGWLYRNVLLPLVMALLWLPGRVMQWLINLLKPLLDIEPDVQDGTLPMETVEQEAENTLGNLERTENVAQIMQFLLMALLAVAAVIGMVLLFRKMGRKSPSAAASPGIAETRSAVESPRERPSEKGSSAVQAVRKHYRRFLKRYGKEGLPLVDSFTSGEIHEVAKNHERLGANSGRIRQLYIRARYGGYAAKEDVKEMGKLCAETKKQS